MHLVQLQTAVLWGPSEVVESTDSKRRLQIVVVEAFVGYALVAGLWMSRVSTVYWPLDCTFGLLVNGAGPSSALHAVQTTMHWVCHVVQCWCSCERQIPTVSSSARPGTLLRLEIEEWVVQVLRERAPEKSAVTWCPKEMGCWVLWTWNWVWFDRIVRRSLLLDAEIRGASAKGVSI